MMVVRLRIQEMVIMPRCKEIRFWRHWSSQTICHVTPSTVVVVSVFFGFAAVATAADDERFGVVDGHFEKVDGF